MLDIFHREDHEVSDSVKEDIRIVKNLAMNLYNAIEGSTNAKLGMGTHTHPEQARRCESVAKTKLEEAVMWAVKGLTT